MAESVPHRRGPYDGLRVLEIASIGPGPYCAMMLADLGADVVRVDRPGPPPVDGATAVLNRGRRSVAIDLKHPRAVDVVLSMIPRCDVLIEGFRPGVMERLGLGPDRCLTANPRLIFARMTGWGQEGPLAQRAGHDITYLARTGALHAIGSKEQGPQVPLNLVGDFGAGGMALAAGIGAALWERSRSGAGQIVDAAIVDGVASLMAMPYGLMASGFWEDERGTNLLDGAAPFYTVYETADEKWMAVGAVEDKFYGELVRVLEVEGLPDRNDKNNWPAIRATLAKQFRRRTQEEWSAAFDKTDACVAPVLSMTEAPKDPHLAHRSSYMNFEGLLQPAPAPRFSRTPGALTSGPVLPGTHTVEVLEEFGLHDVDLLLEAKVAEQC